uniref:Gasdermin pore forming domain-containing protein n=1 Tax=Sus scrofa TaxID=9823 RepID=A0A8D0MR46_PIG
MPKEFEAATRAVVREVDPQGDWIAVRSLTDADRFHCLYLVKKKKRFFGHQYDKADLRLVDILEVQEGDELFDKLVSGLQDHKAPFRVTDNVDSKGGLTVKLPENMMSEVATYRSRKHSVEVLGTRIPRQLLAALENTKLKRKLPDSFQSIRAMREDLYLVTETLTTTKTETLESEQGCVIQLLVDCLGFRYRRKRQKAVTVPPGTVLGYRLKQLVFPNEESMNIISEKTKSFPHEKDGGASCLGKSLSLEGSRSMKEKVQDLVRVLQDLTEKEQKRVLSCLTKCLTEDEQLRDLQQRVSEVQRSGELRMEGPAGPLISSLFNTAGILVEARVEALWDVLDALEELSEERRFVAEALENRTLPLLKGEMESILEQNLGEKLGDEGFDPEARTLRGCLHPAAAGEAYLCVFLTRW